MTVTPWPGTDRGCQQPPPAPCLALWALASPHDPGRAAASRHPPGNGRDTAGNDKGPASSRFRRPPPSLPGQGRRRAASGGRLHGGRRGRGRGAGRGAAGSGRPRGVNAELSPRRCCCSCGGSCTAATCGSGSSGSWGCSPASASCSASCTARRRGRGGRSASVTITLGAAGLHGWDLETPLTQLFSHKSSSFSKKKINNETCSASLFLSRKQEGVSKNGKMCRDISVLTPFLF